jgi:hypothetical protein
MSLAGPQPVSSNPVLRLANDLRAERAAKVPFPHGATDFSATRTRRMLADPLGLLLDGYAEFGPVFTLRIFHGKTVFMIGPAANHHMLVSHAKDFSWREGHMGDLIPLLGDGLLTIDGEFHRRSRKIMLPVFHHERIAAAQGQMADEIEAAVRTWRPGDEIDIYGGRGDWRCGSRCGPCSASTPIAPRAGSTPPSSSSARWGSGASRTSGR